MESSSNGAATYVTIWMNRPERRNALSLDQMRRLRRAFAEVGDSDALGVVLAGKGPVFSAGHDFADIAGADLPTVRTLLAACTDLMDTMQAIPQVVDRPGPRARDRGRVPARGDVRPRRRGRDRGVRRPGRQGRLVLHHADGRDRPQPGSQARARARAHRRHDRRRDRAAVGARQPGGARRRARRRDARPAAARDAGQRARRRDSASRRSTARSVSTSRRPTRTRWRSWPPRARPTTRRRVSRAFLEKRPPQFGKGAAD